MPALDLRELGPLGDGKALPRERGSVQWHRKPLRAEVLQPAAGYDDITPRAFRRQSLNCCSSATGAVVSFVGEVCMPSPGVSAQSLYFAQAANLLESFRRQESRSMSISTDAPVLTFLGVSW